MKQNKTLFVCTVVGVLSFITPHYTRTDNVSMQEQKPWYVQLQQKEFDELTQHRQIPYVYVGKEVSNLHTIVHTIVKWDTDRTIPTMHKLQKHYEQDYTIACKDRVLEALQDADNFLQTQQENEQTKQLKWQLHKVMQQIEDDLLTITLQDNDISKQENNNNELPIVIGQTRALCGTTCGSAVKTFRSKVEICGDTTVKKNLTVCEDLVVKGSTRIKKDLTVCNDLIVKDDLEVRDKATVRKNLTVCEDLIVKEDATIGCDLEVGCNLLMNDSSGPSVGNILKNSTRFIHNFGTKNTFVGKKSGNFILTGGRNTAIGYNTLLTLSEGLDNVAVGLEALTFIRGGSNNTAVGSGALNKIQIGNDNIALGKDAGSAHTGGDSNNIDIGNTGTSGDSNVIRIGTSGTHTKTFITGIRGVTTDEADATAVMIDSDNQLGTVSSSKKYKHNIVAMGHDSDNLMQLRPVSFAFKSDKKERKQYGLIAEEVELVFPELVTYNSEKNVHSVKYHMLPAMLLNEVQKHDKTLQKYSERLDTYGEDIKQLKTYVTALEEKIDKK